MIVASQLTFTWFALGLNHCLTVTLRLLGLWFSAPTTQVDVDWKDSSCIIVYSNTYLGPAKQFSKVKIFLLNQIFRKIRVQSSSNFVGIFSIILAHKSLMLWDETTHFWRGLLFSPHTSFAAIHSQRACVSVSSSKLQRGQMTWSVTFCLKRFILVRRMSWQARHKKCLAEPGISNLYVALQYSSLALGFEVSPRVLLPLLIFNA